MGLFLDVLCGGGGGGQLLHNVVLYIWWKFELFQDTLHFLDISKFKMDLTWLSFVVSSVSLSLSHWYPGSGVALDCIDS